VRALYKHLLAQLQSHFLEIGNANQSPTIIAKSPADEMFPAHAIEGKQIRRSFAMSWHTFVDIVEKAPDQF